MSAVFQDSDESVERVLFERRARASSPDHEAGVPSIDAVLRATRRERPAPAAFVSHETSSARRRAWGLALAAACLLTVMKARPSDVARPAIVPDARAEAPAMAGASAGFCGELDVGTCASETSCAALPPVAEAPAPRDDGVCSATVPAFASSATLACAPDDAPPSNVH